MSRFVGTGRDELGRYGEGVVVDVDQEAAKGLLERGWIEELPAADHPGRTRYQLAQAVVRNDLLSEPDDRAAAIDAGFIEEHEGTSTYTATPEAHRVAGEELADEPDTGGSASFGSVSEKRGGLPLGLFEHHRSIGAARRLRRWGRRARFLSDSECKMSRQCHSRPTSPAAYR
jgi:hypothetical protein